jgi:hypothetical protein
MENLKITFNIESPVIFQNRFTTIDSILLSIFFTQFKEKNKITGFIKTEDLLDEIGKFIEVKNGIISGSIWYLDKNNPIYKGEYRMFKSMKNEEYAKYGFFIDTPLVIEKGKYKAYDLHFPLITTPNIYFYITGDKNKITELIKNVKYLGKKIKIGFGFTDEEAKIEEIDENKGIMLNKNTVSKPIPCSKFTVNTHRIMFYRPYPPYWLKDGKVACYMPPMYYTETDDISFNEDYNSISSIDYISPTEYVYYNTQKIIDYTFKKQSFTPTIPEKKHTCIMCGGNNGIKRTIKEKESDFFPKTFNDFGFIGTGDYICDFCKIVECSDNINQTANLFISKDKNEYIGGKNIEDKIKESIGFTKTKKEFNEILNAKKREIKLNFFKNIKNITPPFLITLKNKSNSVHLIFKSTINISNAMFQVFNKMHGNMIIDTEMFLGAINELDNAENKKDMLYSISKHIDFKSKYTHDVINLLRLIHTVEED